MRTFAGQCLASEEARRLEVPEDHQQDTEEQAQHADDENRADPGQGTARPAFRLSHFISLDHPNRYEDQCADPRQDHLLQSGAPVLECGVPEVHH